MTGIERIAEERARHQDEQWSEFSDDRQVRGELALAAVCYAMPPRIREEVPVRAGDLGEGWVSCSRNEAEFYLPELWPYAPHEWRPAGQVTNEARIRELVRAGSLIAAEIDRLERLTARSRR